MELVLQNQKTTAVGLLPLDWEVKSIRDVCVLINGRGFKPFEWKKEGLPIIRIQNLNGSIDYNYYDGLYDKKIEVENGQLLFAWSGSRGTSFGPHIWFGSKALLNYHTWKIVINEDKIDKSYFNHALKVLTKYIEENAHGASALVHTQKWEMEGFQFPTPPTKAEQATIATALSDADALISSLEKFIAKKRNIKQGAMQKLLEPKEGWEVKKLGEVLKGIQLGGNYPNSEVISDFPLIKMGNIQRGYISTSKIEYIISDFFPEKRDKLNFGDVLFNTRNTLELVGKVSIWKDELEIAYFNSNLMRFEFSQEYISSNYFMNSIFNTQNIISKLKDIATGTTSVAAIYTRDLIKLEISIPSKQEQTRIATILSDMDTEITALEIKLEKYKKVKLGMMQNLLTGKIRLV